MNASEVRESLLRRWPTSEYLSIEEAPQSSDRQGRKLDVVVVSLWRSRGYELDGVEVKVSHADWMRELNNAAKADWWWNHVHRFWIAVPVGIVAKVRETLPSTWGLLACDTNSAPKVVVQPTKHAPEALPWPACIGIMRAASGAGFNALDRSRRAGWDEGYKRGKADAERQSGDLFLQAEVEKLRGIITTFEKTAGVKLAEWDAGRVGQVVAVIEKHLRDPEWFVRRLRSAAEGLTTQAAQLGEVADELVAALQPGEASA